jgi:hypothetical protein
VRDVAGAGVMRVRYRRYEVSVSIFDGDGWMLDETTIWGGNLGFPGKNMR